VSSDGQSPRGRRLPTRAPGEAPPRESIVAVARVAPRPEEMLGRGTVAPGAVAVAVRWWRAAQAAVALVLSLLLAVGAWWWSTRDLAAWRTAAEVVAPVEAPAPVIVAIDPSIRVRTAARPPPSMPADAVMYLPGDVRFYGWTLSCSGWKQPLAANSGEISAGQSSVRIPLVPPVPCRISLKSNSADPQKSITAGEQIACRRDPTLVLVCTHPDGRRD
jgi:hypothetical protein